MREVARCIAPNRKPRRGVIGGADRGPRRRHRDHVRKLVARWTGENQLMIEAVLDDMIARCRAHNLRAAGSERKLLSDFTVLVTAKTMHALFGPSQRKWIAL